MGGTGLGKSKIGNFSALWRKTGGTGLSVIPRGRVRSETTDSRPQNHGVSQSSPSGTTGAVRDRVPNRISFGNYLPSTTISLCKEREHSESPLPSLYLSTGVSRGSYRHSPLLHSDSTVPPSSVPRYVLSP